MDAYGGLTRYVGAAVAAGRLPRMRVALLAPGARNERYAANPAYAATLVDHVVPFLAKACPSPVAPVLMGQSLGALAALHAAWTSPGVFAGLFLQSGSFFTPDLDPQESGFEYWPEVTGFVATVLAAEVAAPGVTGDRDRLRHAPRRTRQQQADGRPPPSDRRRRDLVRGPRRPHLDVLARPAGSCPDRPDPEGV